MEERLRGKIVVCVTVDWEGDHIENLSDLSALRKGLPTPIPLTHFICPSYSTRQWESIKRSLAILPADEIALHLHPYKKLIKTIPGITYRFHPNYYNRHILIEKLPSPFFDPIKSFSVSGRGVPLTAYSADALRAILESAKQKLENTFSSSPIQGFRAGGWIVNDSLMALLEKSGICYDSSAVPPEILSAGYQTNAPGNMKDNYGDNNGKFTPMVIQTWGHQMQEDPLFYNKRLKSFHPEAISTSTQPFPLGGISTHQHSSGTACRHTMYELPNNGGLTDFASIEKTMRPQLTMAKEYLSKNPSGHFYINIGCHQEGAIAYKHELFRFIKELLAEPISNDVISFSTLSDYYQTITTKH